METSTIPASASVVGLANGADSRLTTVRRIPAACTVLVQICITRSCVRVSLDGEVIVMLTLRSKKMITEVEETNRRP